MGTKARWSATRFLGNFEYDQLTPELLQFMPIRIMDKLPPPSGYTHSQIISMLEHRVKRLQVPATAWSDDEALLSLALIQLARCKAELEEAREDLVLMGKRLQEG